jgi:hypothetical protein
MASPVLYVNTDGEASDVGRTFNYQVVVMPAEAADGFRRLRKDYSGIPELPAGTVSYDSISVVRI